MEILFIVPYIPDLVRVRPYNLVRSLARRGHRITLLTLWSHAGEVEGLERLKETCATVLAVKQPVTRVLANGLAALPSGQPLQAWYAWNPKLASQIEAVVQDATGKRKFDIIHVEHLRGVRYAQHLNSFWDRQGLPLERRAPIVWDSVDCISHLFRQSAAHSASLKHRLVTLLELGRTERYEGRLVGQFSRVLVTSQLDKDALAALAQKAGSFADGRTAEQLAVIPNGVDLEYFQPDPQVRREENSMVVSGKMSYHANVTMVTHLVENIMPLIWAKCPDVRLYIVGKDPSKKIISLSNHPNITVTGTVADIRPYLQRAALAAAPLVYGAGIQNKVLESMACETPVIATPLAISALQAAPDQNLLVAQEPADFADKAVAVLADPARRRMLGTAGRDYVLRNHHWDRITERLEEVYHALN